MKHIVAENPRRISTYPTETLDEFTRAREKAEDLAVFEAQRLLNNGWTYSLERSYQETAAELGKPVPEGNRLLAALEAMEIAQKADQARRAQATSAVKRGPDTNQAQTETAPHRASEELTGGPVWDDEDPGMPPERWS